MSGDLEPKHNPEILGRKTWLFLAVFFCLYLLFFLIFSPFQFLDGDDAMQAIWTLAKKSGINPYQFPLHGYHSRSGTFALIYISSYLFGSPRVAFAILSALSAALALAILPVYSCFILGIRPKPIHWLLVLATAVEVVYAGLYTNAAVIGYCLAFWAIFLSLAFILSRKSNYYFHFSNGIAHG